jgi:hypothetical protein
MLALVASAAHAFVPQAGTWVVTQEVNGKPGRGLAIDVQNGTLMFQMYAYENSGAPTFYLAVGPLVDNQVTTEMHSYQGGRYFGSGDRSGVDRGSAGNVSLRFVDGTHGFIRLPGEPEKAISRFNFGYPEVPDSLKGLWLFNTYSPTFGWQVDAPEFTTVLSATANGSGVVVSSDRLLSCEHIVRGELAGVVVCAKYRSAGSTTLQHVYAFKYSIHEGEGDWYPNNGQTPYGFYPQRMTTLDGHLTGLLRKSNEGPLSAEAQANIIEAMDQAILSLLHRNH